MSIFRVNNLSIDLKTWTIQVRVVKKYPVKTWKNEKNSGKYFIFDVMDGSGQIRIAAFRELVDKFFNYIQVDNIYQISNGLIKLANKQFNSNSHEYEIVVDNSTSIIEIFDSDVSIPTQNYNIILLNEVLEKDKGSLVDLIGICWKIDNLEVIPATSSQQEFRKRNVILVDEKCYLTFTLWNDDAEQFDYPQQSVLLVHNGRVSEYRGEKYVTMGKDSVFVINPRIPENRFICEKISGNFLFHFHFKYSFIIVVHI